MSLAAGRLSEIVKSRGATGVGRAGAVARPNRYGCARRRGLARRAKRFRSTVSRRCRCGGLAISIHYIYTGPIQFEYDPGKAAANLKKHKVPLADAEGVLYDPLAVTVDDVDSEGERRFVSIGLGSAGELLVVVYTERDGSYRLISARRPTRKERKQYEG